MSRNYSNFILCEVCFITSDVLTYKAFMHIHSTARLRNSKAKKYRLIGQMERRGWIGLHLLK